MFKLFFIYPLLALIALWLISDVDIKASVYALDENYISIEFPKHKFRSEPWYRFYWNGDSALDELKKINN